METKILKVTPEMAAKMLENKVNNRRLLNHTVDNYADQMKRGQWRLTGQGLSFSYDGKLLDGQNRLAAVIKANRTIEFLVILGVDETAFDVYDSGKIRSSSDVFSIYGVKSASNVASIITAYEGFCRSISANAEMARKQSFFTKIDLFNMYNKNPELWDKIERDSEKFYHNLRIFRLSVIGAFIAYTHIQKKHEYLFIINFFEQLFRLREYSNPSVNRLTNLLIKDGLENRKLTQKSKLALLIKVWNAYLINRDLKQLKFTSDENFPEIN